MLKQSKTPLTLWDDFTTKSEDWTTPNLNSQKEKLLAAVKSGQTGFTLIDLPVHNLDDLQTVDSILAGAISALTADDLLMVTATDSVDRTVGPNSTREYLPILMTTPAYPVGHSVGIRRTLNDVGSTILDNWGLESTTPGHSLLPEIIQ